MSRDQSYISEVRRDVNQLWSAYNSLKSKQREWNALDYGNSLADGINNNDGITRADVGAAVFDAVNNIETVLNQGNATNLAKLL